MLYLLALHYGQTSFSIAVAHEKYLYHYKIPPSTPRFVLFCKVFAFFILYTYHADIYRIGKTGQNVALCTTQL